MDHPERQRLEPTERRDQADGPGGLGLRHGSRRTIADETGFPSNQHHETMRHPAHLTKESFVIGYSYYTRSYFEELTVEDVDMIQGSLPAFDALP